MRPDELTCCIFLAGRLLYIMYAVMELTEALMEVIPRHNVSGDQ